MYHYVLVMTNNGPVFVTDVNRTFSEWDNLKAPMELGKGFSEDVVTGLNMNGFHAYVVVSKTRITEQPYYYRHGKLKWVPKPLNEIATGSKEGV